MNRAILILALSGLLSACVATPLHFKEVMRSFDAPGVTRVILRAIDAAETSEVNLPASVPPSVSIIGTPYVGTERHRQLDLNWRRIPFSRSGVDFVSRRFGSTLVISTKNEIKRPDREYTLQGIHLWISLPQNIHVIREPRKPTRDGAPDFSTP